VQLLTASRATQAPPVPAIAPASSAAVEATKPVAAIADIGTLLSNVQTESTTESAFAKLLSLWNAEYREDVARPCEQALNQGLECVYQKGSWGQLRILNRPVILSLTDDKGRAHQVVLTSLNDSSAQVVLAGAPQEVSISSLSKFWLGDYLLLWRPQSAGQRALAVGMRGDEVRWLRRSLDRLQNLTPAVEDLPNDYYDEALAKRVETFQREHRLTVDGIAGVQTQIVLDSAVDASNAPRLLSLQSAPTNGRQTT
jgi:general secretion pathway protein A